VKYKKVSILLSALLIFITLSNPLISAEASWSSQVDPPENDLQGVESVELLDNEIVSVTQEVFSENNVAFHYTYADETQATLYGVNGPSSPPAAYQAERTASLAPVSGATAIPDFPSFSWVFGCGAVSGGMIAAYYDRNGYPNMYTGPTNGGVYPLTDTSWATWYDGYTTYPNNPIVASHKDVDGRTTRGSIDHYWVKNNSTAPDPYITNGWTPHDWGDAIGDYMKTSQSAYGNYDANSWIYYYSGYNDKMTCSAMEGFTTTVNGLVHKASDIDLTYGSMLFYQTRGYTVTQCYNQRTDNKGGGFTLANFKAEIDAGRPVLLFVLKSTGGHFMVGYGYSGSTIFIRDTWDNNPSNNFTMPWGGSYQGYTMEAVSIIHLEPPVVTNYPLTVTKTGTGSGTVTSSPPGIDCGSTCSAHFPSGTSVTLTASPNTGSTFTGWSGACTGSSPTCVVSMTQAKIVTATFTTSGPATTFADVPMDHQFYSWIETLVDAGITSGCSTDPPLYCPDQSVTRGQMAIFLLKGKYGSDYKPPAVGTTSGFNDVPTSHSFAAWIKQLAFEEITSGCGGGNFCPDAPVTREQMAIFLLKGMYGSDYKPPDVGASTGFLDVTITHPFAKWIKQLVAEGITSGCGGGNYCPFFPVTRAQMAVFLVKAFLESTPPPPPPPPPPPTIPIVNGDFEAGPGVGWTEYSYQGWPLIVQYNPGMAHSGDWGAWLGGDHNEIARLSQVVTIPINQYYLHFYYDIYSEDTCDYDFARLKVNETTFHTFDLCSPNQTTNWVHAVANLSAYQGSTVTLSFEVVTDGTFISSFYLDTISLTSSASAPPRTTGASASASELYLPKNQFFTSD
jgi:hypothetical protein